MSTNTDFNADTTQSELKAAQLSEIKKAFQLTDAEVRFLMRLHAGSKEEVIGVFL